LKKPEIFYPLKVHVCNYCWLVQTENYTRAESLFTPEYAYFSSISEDWLDHAKNYTEKVIKEFSLNKDSYVIEIASNDGYLLKNFLAAGIPCLGIEPTDSTANAAKKIGIPLIRKFFNKTLALKLASERQQADLVIGNNVYAHVPDINDFTQGLKAILKPGGTITLEFPHLLTLVEHTHFDTVYHEHFSYLSLYTVCKIFKSAGLSVWNVEEIPTHGGSLRVYGCHSSDTRKKKKSVKTLLKKEKQKGLRKLKTYQTFQERTDKIKNDLLTFLIKQKRNRKKVFAYGAAAKGNTLLNYAGIKKDLLPLVCDAAISKQGKFMPGSHIPILKPDHLTNKKPDYILILPWNLEKEIRIKIASLIKSKIKFVIAVPKIKIFSKN
jgi:SAM-dependent methyltransferase